MHKIVVWLDKNGMAEEDNKQWVELVVLAGSTLQENVPCHE